MLSLSDSMLREQYDDGPKKSALTLAKVPVFEYSEQLSMAWRSFLSNNHTERTSCDGEDTPH